MAEIEKYSDSRDRKRHDQEVHPGIDDLVQQTTTVTLVPPRSWADQYTLASFAGCHMNFAIVLVYL